MRWLSRLSFGATTCQEFPVGAGGPVAFREVYPLNIRWKEKSAHT
jgi:hypothetical protein